MHRLRLRQQVIFFPAGGILTEPHWLTVPEYTGSGTTELVISNAGAAQQGAYHAVITGNCGIVPCNIATLSLLSSSIITSQPSAGIKCEGETITISLTAAGSGNTYQWKKNGVVLINSGHISGAQQNSLTINSLLPGDAGSYNCIVNNAENSIPAMLNVNRTTRIVSSSAGANLCLGDAITFETIATGDSLDFAWYKNNIIFLTEGRYRVPPPRY